MKHTEAYVWQEFRIECDKAFSKYKKSNPDKVLDDNDFYLVAEVYNYGISSGRDFNFGDKKVDYFDKAFTSSINFEFKWNAAQMPIEDMYSKYNKILQTDLKDYGVLNYLSSHDDGNPFDPKREKPFETATKLLLSPGASQVYYGDESARSLVIEGTVGDATLRSNMNWEAITSDEKTKNILNHWQKLGQFRVNHPALGAGVHQAINQSPFVFSRSYTEGEYSDHIVVALGLEKGEKVVNLGDVFKDGDVLRDAYSNQNIEVKDGVAKINSEFQIVLLEKQ